MSVRLLVLSAALPLTIPFAHAASASATPSAGAVVESTDVVGLRNKAERGNAIAQYNLGLAYAEGRSVARDLTEAFVWLTLAAENGSTGKALETVLNTLDSAQLSVARERLEQRRKTNPALRSGAQAARKSTSLASDASPTATPQTSGSPSAEKSENSQLTPEPAPVNSAALEVSAVASELAAAREEIAKLRAELSRRSTSQAVRTDPAVAALQGQLREAQVNLAAQSTELAAKRVEAETSRTELTKVQASATQVKIEADELKSRLLAVQAEQHRAEQKASEAQQDQQKLAAELEKLRSAQTGTTRTHSDGLERDLAAARTSATRAAEELAANRSAADKVAAQLREELESVRGQRESERGVAENAKAETARLQAELEGLRTRLAGADETTRSAAATNTQRASQLDAELSAARRELATQASAIESARAERDRVTSLSTELDVLKQASAEQREKLAQAEKQLAAARGENDRTRTQLAELSNAQSTSERDAAATLRAEVDRLQRELTAAHAAREAAGISVRSLEAKYAETREEARRAAEGVTGSKAELDQLRQDRDRLSRELNENRGVLETKLRQTEAELAQVTAASPSLKASERAKAAAEEKLAISLRSYAMVAKERDEHRIRLGDLNQRLERAEAAARQSEQTRADADARVAAAEEKASAAAAEAVRLRQQIASATVAEQPVARAEPAQGVPTQPVAMPNQTAVRPPLRPAPATLAAQRASTLQPPVVNRSHTVVAGETLSGIARQYYGTAARWTEIYAANRDVIREERQLIAGQTLTIP